MCTYLDVGAVVEQRGPSLRLKVVEVELVRKETVGFCVAEVCLCPPYLQFFVPEEELPPSLVQLQKHRPPLQRLPHFRNGTNLEPVYLVVMGYGCHSNPHVEVH